MCTCVHCATWAHSGYLSSVSRCCLLASCVTGAAGVHSQCRNASPAARTGWSVGVPPRVTAGVCDSSLLVVVVLVITTSFPVIIIITFTTTPLTSSMTMRQALVCVGAAAGTFRQCGNHATAVELGRHSIHLHRVLCRTSGVCRRHRCAEGEGRCRRRCRIDGSVND